MKERPILFSAPMVRALLDGSKTQTRRIIKTNNQFHRTKDGRHFFHDGSGNGDHFNQCPHGKIGDRLWVREKHYEKGNWIRMSFPDADSDDFYWSGSRQYLYAATDEKPKSGYRAWPSIHMKRTASRITLEITNVRVERLQDISEVDAKAEGVLTCEGGAFDYLANDYAQGFSARSSLLTLWQSINGADSWQANPWVWVIEFRSIASLNNPTKPL